MLRSYCVPMLNTDDVLLDNVEGAALLYEKHGVRSRSWVWATRFTPSASTTPSFTMRQENGTPTGLHIRFRQLNQALLEIHDDPF